MSGSGQYTPRDAIRCIHIVHLSIESQIKCPEYSYKGPGFYYLLSSELRLWYRSRQEMHDQSDLKQHKVIDIETHTIW